MKYKLYKNPVSNENSSVEKVGFNMSIPFDPANTDYVNFKSQINADEAQLENADGVLMSPEEAKAFVSELP